LSGERRLRTRAADVDRHIVDRDGNIDRMPAEIDELQLVERHREVAGRERHEPDGDVLDGVARGARIRARAPGDRACVGGERHPADRIGRQPRHDVAGPRAGAEQDATELRRRLVETNRRLVSGDRRAALQCQLDLRRLSDVPGLRRGDRELRPGGGCSSHSGTGGEKGYYQEGKSRRY
jgi:hypothetical protein